MTLQQDLRNESKLFKQRADGRVFLEVATTCAKKLWQKRREQGNVKRLELKGGECGSRYNGRAK